MSLPEVFSCQPAEITDEGVVVRGRWNFQAAVGADIVGVGISPLKNNEMQGYHVWR